MSEERTGIECSVVHLAVPAQAAADLEMADREMVWDGDELTSMVLRGHSWLIARMADSDDDPYPLWAVFEPAQALWIAMGAAPTSVIAFESPLDAQRLGGILAAGIADLDAASGGMDFEQDDVYRHVEDKLIGGPLFLDKNGKPCSALTEAIEERANEMRAELPPPPPEEM